MSVFLEPFHFQFGLCTVMCVKMLKCPERIILPDISCILNVYSSAFILFLGSLEENSIHEMKLSKHIIIIFSMYTNRESELASLAQI